MGNDNPSTLCFLKQPASDSSPFELHEGDVVWSFYPSNNFPSASPPSPHRRRHRHRFSPMRSGLSAALEDHHFPPMPLQMMPANARPPNASPKFRQSAPVNVPVWPERHREGYGKSNLWRFDEVEDDDEEKGEEKMIPPHVIVARSHVTSSVFEGVGRTLKGRDLCRVRNAVFQKTGLIE
ncbi:hypothetical protein Sango_0738200 [Sesamum angolense]|uniref:Senescence regulator n=1 Tax=Sesamum angolense TaxID=2727404 RepID=A0AAE1X210_9LAMI|nr:hypothetical protein Sango_0738200 [Sesamum angolense]